MSLIHRVGGRSLKNAAVAALVSISVTACAGDVFKHEKPMPPTDKKPNMEPSVLQGLAITFDAKGNLVVTGPDGQRVEGRCSGDPSSSNACSIFKNGHKVQVEQVIDMSIIQFHGSPQCIVILRGGVFYQYCK